MTCWQPKSHLDLSQNTSPLASKASWCSVAAITLSPAAVNLKRQTKILDLKALLEKELSSSVAKTH